jgi:hypothetical protein
MRFAILVLLVLLVALLGVVLWMVVGWRWHRRRALQLARSLAVEQGQEVFEESMVKGLPETAQRYLLHAIRPGTRIARSLRLRFEGSMQFGADPTRWPLDGDNIVITPERGFVWFERLRYRGVPRNGLLYYAANRGGVIWSYWNLLQDLSKASGTGPDATRAIRGRFLSKLVWMPSALLPQNGVRWEAADDQNVKAIITVDGDTVPLSLKVDAQGRLQEMVFPRWGAKNADGSYGLFPYGVKPEGETTVDGYTIPSQVAAVWCYGDEERVPPLVHRYHVKDLQFT